MGRTMKKPKPKTLQQIYDFCLLDPTFNFYFNIPDHFACKTREQYKYYYGNLGSRGLSRSGTFLYHQSLMQLYRFMGLKPDWNADSLLFFIDAVSFEMADRDKYEYPHELIYIRVHIRRKGAEISFSHPFNRMLDVTYVSRSHHPYTPEGIRLDVIEYINKNLLYPPGRFRDLQLEHKVVKKDFIDWYKSYKIRMAYLAEDEHWSMVEKYSKKPQYTDYDEAYWLLSAHGIFQDFGYDTEGERDELTEEFMNLCNR